MAKYQFFSKPDSNRKEFTYLMMDSESFLIEKAQLLDLGFEVDGDVIYADSAQEAVEKFKSNFIAPLDDYAKSTAEGGFATLLLECFRALRKKR